MASGLKISAPVSPLLLFLHCRSFSCLRRTWWDGVKRTIEQESLGKPANPGENLGEPANPGGESRGTG